MDNFFLFTAQTTFSSFFVVYETFGRTGDQILMKNPGTEVTRLVLIAGQPIGKPGVRGHQAIAHCRSISR